MNDGGDDDDDEEEEFDPLKLVETECGWTIEISEKIIELAKRCAAKYKRRPTMDEVLQELLNIQAQWAE